MRGLSPEIARRFLAPDMKRLFFTFVLTALAVCPVIAQEARSRQEGEVVGPVQTVRVERAALSKKADKVVEGARVLLSAFTYDQRGNLIDSSLNRLDGALFKK